MLYYNTVNDILKNSLQLVMQAEIFTSFRLVGGTALSLHLGHRESVDIDLFSDAQYGSVDFEAITEFLKSNFNYVDHLANVLPAMGKSFIIGNNETQAVKLDVFYTDPFIHDIVYTDNIRLASVEEIIAMKIDVIQRGGRKKDFWDLHEILDNYSIAQMIALHKQRYPWGHEAELIVHNLIDFTKADNDFDPVCLRGKHWEFIKADFEDEVNQNYQTLTT